MTDYKIDQIAYAWKLDAAESAFTARQIEHVRAKAYDLHLKELRARVHIPVDTSVPSGATTVTYRQYSPVGTAKLIHSYAEDLPRANVFVKEFTSNVRGLGASYGISLQELRAAAMTNVNLQAQDATAARRAIEQLIDKLAQVGDANHNMLGLLNQPNTTAFTPPNGAWAAATPDQIVEDMNGIANTIVESTNGREIPDTLLLPIKHYTKIASTRMGDGSDVTILQHFLMASPFIKNVDHWYALKGAGAGATDRMVCYRKDPDYVQLVIPQEFEQMPPEPRGLTTETACHARCGGVVVYYPLSMAYGDGI